MQIILAVIVGAVLGLAVHFQIGHRTTRGVVIAPVVGALAAGIAWAALTWAGLGLDNPWLWVSMLVAPLIVTYPVVILLTRARVAHDTAERARLKIG
jgi:hypothetical protein